MTSLLIAHELALRGAAFLAVFALMAVWEWRAPCRAPSVSRAVRWSNNLALVALNSLLLRMVFPSAALGMAQSAAAGGWGLLHHFHLPFWLATLVAVIALDFVIWLQHVMVHAVPLLWRLHRVHHADLDYDLTTGARFHPLEILLSMLVKFAAIAVLGPPLLAVIIFELVLNGAAMFNHGNVRLPPAVERIARWMVVTPDMHRIHHSTEDDEANSNFGFNLSWWDRLFGTYRAAPRSDQRRMRIGIDGYRAPRDVSWLPGMLALPWRRLTDGYVINRRRGSKQRTGDEQANRSRTA